MACPNKTEKCVNCHNHFEQLRPLVKEVIVSKHFLKDAPDFDVSSITDCKHEYFIRLHKFEETINGNHIFRAIKGRTHFVYAIDKNHSLIFLRAFDNLKEYEKFLMDKRKILDMIERKV